MLCAAAAVSISVWFFFAKAKGLGWIEGVAIILTVILVTTIAAVQDWQKERQFA